MATKTHLTFTFSSSKSKDLLLVEFSLAQEDSHINTFNQVAKSRHLDLNLLLKEFFTSGEKKDKAFHHPKRINYE